MEDKTRGDETSEKGVVSEEERVEEPASSSSQNLSIGRRLAGLVVPMVEGLIISKKGREDGTIDVTMILAPYMKKGGWIKAAVAIKNSAKLSKKSVERYKYPLPWASRLAIEARRNKGDLEWAKSVVEDINTYVKDGSYMSERAKEIVDEENNLEKLKYRINKYDSESSQDSVISKEGEKSKCLLTPRRRSRRISALRKWSRDSSEKDPEIAKKPKEKEQKGHGRRNSIWGTNSRARRSAKKAIRSSSESHDSANKGDLDDKEVWDSEEEDDGIVYCPFSNRDVRGHRDVKESIKGRATERRFIRQALHNLYRHYSSLQTYVDTIRTKANQPGNQPFPLDLVWLEYHAIYIDCVLLENLKGVWALWNEPILDLLVMSFLELVVRCSPRRQYPDKLEERVRRWMKKNQIGISSAFGPIPYYLQNARVTERGVVVGNASSSQYGRGRGFQPYGGRGDGRGRGGNNSSTNFKRGGTRADNKGSSHE